MPDTDVGKRLRMLREARGLTQKEAAEALCIPRTTYVHYEDGSNEPKISMLIKFSAFYGISVDWLVGWDAPKAESPPPESKWEALEKALEKLTENEVKEVWSYVRFLHWKRQQDRQG